MVSMMTPSTSLIYSSNWNTFTASGPYDGSLHYSLTPQEYAQFSFTGQQFTFSYIQMTDRGIVDVYVGGAQVASVNENGAGQWQRTWSSDALQAGVHTVQLVHASGLVVDVDGVQITGTAVVLGSGTHDDADPPWIYSAFWQTFSGAGPSGATLHYLLTPNETAQVSFTGTGFTQTYTQMDDRGLVNVYVDGSYYSTINENGAAQWQQNWVSGTRVPAPTLFVSVKPAVQRWMLTPSLCYRRVYRNAELLEIEPSRVHD